MANKKLVLDKRFFMSQICFKILNFKALSEELIKKLSLDNIPAFCYIRVTMKNCLECSKNIVGRSDKKFCDDSCRNVFNNRQNMASNTYVRQVNTTLRKNRKILQNLLPDNGKTSISEKTLKVLGFNFEYFTHVYETKNGNLYKFCYEFGYLPIDKGVLMLVKKS